MRFGRFGQMVGCEPIYTVKLARTKRPAMATGKLFRRYSYLRMKAKLSAGNDCLQFPPETGGSLAAPVGNLPEAFTVRVRMDFPNLCTFPFI